MINLTKYLDPNFKQENKNFNQDESKNEQSKEISKIKYNWEQLKSEFVEGNINENGIRNWPTLKEISDKYNIDYSYIRKISSNQNWKDCKQLFIQSFENQRQLDRIKHLSEESIKFDNKCIKIVNKGIKVLEDIFEISENTIDENGNRQLLNLDTLDIITKSLERLQKIGRLALGSSTENISNKISGITFADELDKINQQLKLNTTLKDKLINDFIDK